MSDLRLKQHAFAHNFALLILRAEELGFRVTLGDAYRDPRVFGPPGEFKGYGHAASCHKLRLAGDINLFAGDTLLTGTKDHAPLGSFWEALGGSWGGAWNDGNHYSIRHNGYR